MSNVCSIIALCIILAGCTTFHGLRPIAPDKIAEISNVRPSFQWQPCEKQKCTYDFILYDRTIRQNVPVPGATVFYRENLTTPSVELDVDLAYGQSYLWTVRERYGEKTNSWSTYDFNAYYVLGYVIQRNFLYQLNVVDPKTKKKEGSIGNPW